MPRQVTLDKMTSAWRHVLDSDTLDEFSDFYEEGGNSIRMMSLSVLIHENFQVSVPMIDLMTKSSLGEHAHLVDSLIDVQTIVPLDQRSSIEGLLTTSLASNRQILRQQTIKLERLRITGKAARTIAFTGRIDGKLDSKKLRQAAQVVAESTDAIAGHFAASEQGPIWKVNKSNVLNFEYLIAPDPALGFALLKQRAELPINVLTGPLLKLCLVEVSRDYHYLLLQVSHLCIDGWSLQMLVSNVVSFYNRMDRSPEELESIFPSFWSWVSEKNNEYEAGYGDLAPFPDWCNYLSEYEHDQVPSADLQNESSEDQVHSHSTSLGPSWSKRVERSSRVNGVTKFAVLLSSLHISSMRMHPLSRGKGRIYTTAASYRGGHGTDRMVGVLSEGRVPLLCAGDPGMSAGVLTRLVETSRRTALSLPPVPYRDLQDRGLLQIRDEAVDYLVLNPTWGGSAMRLGSSILTPLPVKIEAAEDAQYRQFWWTEDEQGMLRCTVRLPKARYSASDTRRCLSQHLADVRHHVSVLEQEASHSEDLGVH